MLNNKATYKYKTTYAGPFDIIQRWNNGTVILPKGAARIRYNICSIKPYKSKTHVGDVHP